MIKEGIINIKKPKGYTSHDCVNVIRSLTGVKRVGHTGTLDPMAEGVLPVCIGSAARIMEYLDLDFKRYKCEILLGIETDTLDIWGKVLSDNSDTAKSLIDSNEIDEDKIKVVLNSFLGSITQIPPKYSAIKVNGRKLYEYARSGQEVEIASRQVYIKSIELLGLNLEERTFSFDVVCSKGTYIRSICRDIGDILGCGASMSALTRTASGRFEINESISIDSLKQLKQGEDIRDNKTGRVVKYARALPEDINKHIINVEYPLVHFGKIILNEDRVKWFCNGGYIQENELILVKEPEFKEKMPHIQIRNEFRKAYNVYEDAKGEEVFLGVAFYDDIIKKYKADKVFCRG